VTSRYPLWDMKSPEKTAEVPHTVAGDKATHIAVGGKDTHASVELSQAQVPRQPSEAPMHIETGHYTAKELGIPMPDPTIKPMIVAFAMVAMVGSMIFMHGENKLFAVAMILGFGALFVGMLYNWLLTPLESEHAHH
jgi:hypothetical protein